MFTKRTGAIALALALVAAACGDDDDDDAVEETAPPEETAPDVTEPPDDTDAPDDTDPPDDTEVDDTTPDEMADDAACEATVPGTQLDYGVWAPAHLIEPTLASGALVGGTELAAVYDVLFRFDFENEEYVPHLAESIESNDDYTEWTLTLRDGITYSDGTPLTAALVDENIDRFFEEGVRNPSAGFLTPIVDREVVDDLTLRLTLEAPWAEFPFVFSDEPGMIVNTNVVGDDLEAFAAEPPDAAGLGPYVIERNAPNEEIVMVARDDYWGGPVCIERLRFVFIPGAQGTYDAFGNQELDVGFLREPAVIEQVRANDEEGVAIQQDSGITLFVNHADGRPGADPRVREAIALAIDEEVVNDRAYQGTLLAGKSMVQEGSRFYSDDIETIPFDPERAADLVEEAKADGFDGSLDLLCQTSPPSPDVALASQGLLEAVGFDVTVENLAVTDQIGQVVAGDFDVACWGVNIGPETGLTSVMRAFRSESTGNRQSYVSEEMDAAIAAMLAADTPESLTAAMADVNNIFVADFVAAPIGAIEEFIVWQPNVEGIVPTTSTIMLFHDAYFES